MLKTTGIPYRFAAKIVVLSGIVLLVLISSTVFVGCQEEAKPEAVLPIAPDFTLQSVNHGPVTLSDEVTQHENTILVFYRGFF
tara:strand:+ start:2014 stop:2262 length:249 start_codon:yes stop_codon:yes gene_type:complete